MPGTSGGVIARRPCVPALDVQVGPADAGALDPHLHLTGARLRLGQLHHLQAGGGLRLAQRTHGGSLAGPPRVARRGRRWARMTTCKRPVAPGPRGARSSAFGLVSLAADMVYEGMRAVSGPFLGSLGASALVVGVVTGAGEAVALVLRLVTGAWADHSRNHWRLTVVGYAMTAVCVPLLAVAPFVGWPGSPWRRR